jgi:hypothetical protein
MVAMREHGVVAVVVTEKYPNSSSTKW